MPSGLRIALRELPERIGSLLGHVHRARHAAEVLQFILETAVELLGADRGDFAMLDANGELKIVAVYPAPAHGTPSKSGTPLSIGASCPRKSVMWTVWMRSDYSTRVIGDVSKLPRAEYYCSAASTRSEAVTRIYFGERKLGVLNVESDKLDFFKDQDEHLRMLAKYAGIAWQLFDEHSRQSKLVAKVLSPSRPADGGELKLVLKEILDVVHEVFRFNGLIYMAKGERLEVCGWHWRGPDKPFGYGPRDHSFAQHAFQQGTAFEPDVEHPVVTVSRKGINAFNITGSLVGVPLDCGSTREGVLVCWGDSKSSRPEAWHQDHLTPIAILAAHRIHVWRVERDRERSRRELERQKDMFESLLNNMCVCVFRKNAKGIFTYVNKRYLEYLHKAEHEVLNRDDYAFFPEADADQYRRDDAYVRKTGNILSISEGGQPSGSKRRHRIQGFKARTEDGSIQCIFWDVEEHFDQGNRRRVSDLISKALPTPHGNEDAAGAFVAAAVDTGQPDASNSKPQGYDGASDVPPEDEKEKRDVWIPPREQVPLMCGMWKLQTGEVEGAFPKASQARLLSKIRSQFESQYPHAVRPQPGKRGTLVNQREWVDFLGKPTAQKFRSTIERKIHKKYVEHRHDDRHDDDDDD